MREKGGTEGEGGRTTGRHVLGLPTWRPINHVCLARWGKG
jgi:hypothetical protein